MVPEGIILPVVSTIGGILVPEGIVLPVVSTIGGILVPEGITHPVVSVCHGLLDIFIIEMYSSYILSLSLNQCSLLQAFWLSYMGPLVALLQIF